MTPEQIEAKDDLQEMLKTLQGQLQAAHRRMDDIEATVESNAARLNDLEGEVNVTKASVPAQSRGKIENVLAVVEHAYERQNGGVAGVKLPSGEVTAVIDGSKQTALRLMDEIAGKFSWATVDNPGGPNPKALKLKTNAPLDERTDHIAERYS